MELRFFVEGRTKRTQMADKQFVDKMNFVLCSGIIQDHVAPRLGMKILGSETAFGERVLGSSRTGGPSFY